MMLVSCNTAEKEWSADGEQSSQELSGDRQLVHHEVSVSLDGAVTRVGYRPSGDGLQLSWEAEASETLGVYIRKSDNSIIYAGQMTDTGNNGDQGSRLFSGNVSAKTVGEKYVYVHPALSGETQGDLAAGTIDFTNQSASLGSTEHLKNFIPLVWEEGQIYAQNNGYAIHLTLSFKEDPGTINKVTLQTMSGVGETEIFPASFDASTMAASTTSKATEVKLTIPNDATNKTATQNGTEWTADAYLVSSHIDIDVFRTKYNVKVEASNGTYYYNEFRSFPGQESADASTGLQMLANGKCYNLITPVSKGVATTVINSQYKVNSLLGMWNQFGKVTDPFNLIKTTGLPTQLQEKIIDTKSSVMDRILSQKSIQGTPTFTWQLLEKQKELSGGYSQTDVAYNNILISKSTEVFVTFISEYAWSQNLLGYYHYSTNEGAPATPGNVVKTIIFPNVSKAGHVPFNKNGTNGGNNINPNGETNNIGDVEDAPIQEFTTVQLLYNYPDGTVSTTFPVGTTIGFMLMRDTQASNGTSGDDGSDTEDTHTGYSPRTDNTLLNWNSWRLFTDTKWNSVNGGWYGGNCSNFFVSGQVVGTDGKVIDGLAIYGAKDDPDHNYLYSFSSMLFMVSTSDASAMSVQVPGALNLGTGDLVIKR